MSIGRKKFNMDPKKGIEYLIEHGLLQNTPDGMFLFFLTCIHRKIIIHCILEIKIKIQSFGVMI